MAVPKKKKSKSKTAIRKNAWKNLILKSARRAISLGRSISKGVGGKFIIDLKEKKS
jgi:ribosomal protein L32